jgi:hypothetical protein
MNLTFCAYICQVADWIIFIYASLLVFYLLFFSLAAYRKKGHRKYPESGNLHRFVIFFPAYKEDAVIENAVSNFFKQNYPKSLYDVVVISDQMLEETLDNLKAYPIIIERVQLKKSTKAKALRFALSQLNNTYDIAVILDADNLVEKDFLKKINNAYTSGQLAIQTHRTAKAPQTNIAILDAASEEINNTIFRLGHVRAGLSSALIGSGMAFDFNLFREIMIVIDEEHVGEDKQMELTLLRKRIFIDYLEDVYTYDEKINKPSKFFNQRRRWLSTQISNLSLSIKDFPQALKNKNWDYCDKLLQWTMPSRVVLTGIVSLFAIGISCWNLSAGIKWICLTGILLGTLIQSIPKYLMNYKLSKAVFMIPLLFAMMIINHFRLAGADKKFIHTSHGDKK